MLKNIFILFIMFTWLACSKNSPDEDKESPVIQLDSPVNNQVFTGGQAVAITGHISDNGILVEIHVHIYDNTSGQLLIDINRFPNAGAYVVNENFQVQAGIQYKIQVIATDKSANQDVENVMITCN